MYRWLLCWLYLRSRYIALASVISVTLGVATLIIVNSVMDGFTTEMQQRMHGILSDIVVESQGPSGLENPQEVEAKIRALVGDQLEGLTTVVHVPAMITADNPAGGPPVTKQINLIGIDDSTYANVSDFSKYLLHPRNQEQISFNLRESGYAPGRKGFPESGWNYRRAKASRQKLLLERLERNRRLEETINAAAVNASQPQPYLGSRPLYSASAGTDATASLESPAAIPQLIEGSGHAAGLTLPAPPPSHSLPTTPGASVATAGPANGLPFDAQLTAEEEAARKFDAEKDQWPGIVLGISIVSQRYRDGEEVKDFFYARPGDDIKVTFPSAGNTPRAVHESFTVVDFYESQMSEYDATFAFVPLSRLQKARGMEGAVSSIQMKLTPGADLNQVRDTLRAVFNYKTTLTVSTWRDLQGALLAAVRMETMILNILLFLIIAVAGFGILATFFMIVVEKTKDIGILKSLGASGGGVAAIFLGYGVLLGTVGALVGVVAGLAFVANINSIADMLEVVTGQEVFDPTVYYFDTIPTIVNPATVVWVTIGSVFVAVLASVLPSIRAARMHPVEALRYE